MRQGRAGDEEFAPEPANASAIEREQGRYVHARRKHALRTGQHDATCAMLNGVIQTMLNGAQ
jgi:hypothetical protein